MGENMKMIGFHLARTLVLAALFVAIPAYASPILVTVDTSALAGTQADLAFDLIDGGPPPNTVTLSGFTTDGTLGASSSTGDVTGAFPGTVTLADTSFFNEYLQNETLGTTFQFILDSTNLPADLTSFPDGFALFLLDHATGLSLVTTSDPTGADALFLWSLGTTTAPDLYSSDTVHVTIGPVNPAPEPSTLSLAMIGIAGLILFSAFGLWRARNRRASYGA
jgi:hypothetical protein